MTEEVELSFLATMKEAVSMANFAAGVVCGEVGVVPIDPERLSRAILGEN